MSLDPGQHSPGTGWDSLLVEVPQVVTLAEYGELGHCRGLVLPEDVRVKLRKVGDKATLWQG